MLHFDEMFAGGFFGVGRSYGAGARFECRSAEEFASDWTDMLFRVAKWRELRRDKARSLLLLIQGPPEQVWRFADLLKERVIVAAAARPRELQGLHLEAAVFGEPDMEQYLDLTLAA